MLESRVGDDEVAVVAAVVVTEVVGITNDTGFLSL
jgi:hypothetical protein